MLVYRRNGVAFKYRERLKITELFYSVQGEGAHAGLPCSFIRLTGCAMRCVYCDTAYAFYGGSWRSFEELMGFVAEQPTRLVQITGGEPLHQKAVWPLVDRLAATGYRPMIETGGGVSIRGLHPKTHIVFDIKTPESGELTRMDWENLDLLKPSDEVKFVVCSLPDLDWSLAKIRELNLAERFRVLISPIAEIADKTPFAERFLASGIEARFQVQLHKLLWGNEAGR